MPVYYMYMSQPCVGVCPANSAWLAGACMMDAVGRTSQHINAGANAHGDTRAVRLAGPQQVASTHVACDLACSLMTPLGVCRLLVKVQLQWTAANTTKGLHPHYIYDERRSFDNCIMPDDDAYQPLLAIIMAHGYNNGTKAYFWCKRASATTLRLFLDERSKSMPMW